MALSIRGKRWRSAGAIAVVFGIAIYFFAPVATKMEHAEWLEALFEGAARVEIRAGVILFSTQAEKQDWTSEMKPRLTYAADPRELEVVKKCAAPASNFTRCPIHYCERTGLTFGADLPSKARCVVDVFESGAKTPHVRIQIITELAVALDSPETEEPFLCIVTDLKTGTCVYGWCRGPDRKFWALLDHQ